MLTRWDPFREMWRMRRMMDRMFDSAFDRQLADWEPEAWSIPLDVVEDEDAFVVKASLPGISPDDLDITFDNNTLTIQGEVKKDEEIEEARYHLRERSYGRFTRTITLSRNVDADRIEANYEKGELRLNVPKTEESKPKRIAIQSGSGQKMLEG